MKKLTLLDIVKSILLNDEIDISDKDIADTIRFLAQSNNLCNVNIFRKLVEELNKDLELEN